MFDFERLDLYQLVKGLNVKVYKYITENMDKDPYLMDLWKETTLEILLNLTEGTGRITKKEKQEYIVEARGKVFESVAIIDFLKSSEIMNEVFYDEIYAEYEQVSKMLLGMYRSYIKQT